MNNGNGLKKQIEKFKEKTGEDITITDLAQSCNVSEDYIRKILRGDRTGSNKVLYCLARQLDCYVDDLLFF